MKVKKAFALLFVAALLIAMFAGCAPKENNEQTQAGMQNGQVLSESLTISGSTSVQPLAEELASSFKEKNANVTIDIQGGGSGVGIKSAMEGVADIGMSSRELKEDEKNLKEYKIAVDGIAVILNPANSVENLTIDQIKKIYKGEITDWMEVGGKQGRITVVTREEGSGTRGAFVELVGIEEKEGDQKIDKTVATAITQGSTGAVLTTVSSDPNAIGYSSFGTTKDNTAVKMIKVDGQSCTEGNLYSGNYKISRPFLMLTKAEPAGLAKSFLDFIMSAEGQEVVESHGYLKAVR